MKKIITALVFSLGFFSLAHADNNDQVQQLNTKIQAQLKQMNDTQQQQITQLNTQFNTQMQKMQSDLQKNIDTMNKSMQAQLQKLQDEIQQLQTPHK